MVWRQGYRRNIGHETTCLCDHARVAHYTRDGNCVVPGCGCKKFRVKHKYNARKVNCGDHAHPSELEARVCGDLRYLMMSGEIENYERQVTINLELNGVRLGKIIPDFRVHHKDGTVEYWEAKGMEMPGWKKKWEILKKMHEKNPIVKFRVIK